MDFELTEEQQLLRHSCERFFADHYGFESRASATRRSRAAGASIVWKQYAELGLLGLPFAEEYGGFGRRAGRDHDRDGTDRPRAGA